MLTKTEAPYDLGPVHEGVTVLPLIRKDGAGLYPQGTNQLVKQLRIENVPSQYLDEPESRQWVVLKGEVPADLLFAIGTGLLSSAIWAAFVKALGKIFGENSKVRVRIVRQVKTPDGSLRNEWFEYEGPPSGLESSRDFTNSNER